MDNDLGPLLPETGWGFLILMSVITAVTIAVVVLATIIGILRYRRKRMRSIPTPSQAVLPPALASRLVEIDGLLAAGRIDDPEHAAMRSRILDLQ